MATDIDIANRALGLAGARSTIGSFTERSNEARIVNLYYDETRDAMMRGAHWNFTRYAAYLSILKAAPGTPENTTAVADGWSSKYPPPPWQYSYAYPSDCVLMRYISPTIFNTSASGGTTPIFSVAGQASPPPFTEIRPQKFMVASDKDKDGNDVRVVLANQDQAIGIYSRRITNPDLWDAPFRMALEAALASRMVMSLAGDKVLKKQLQQDAMTALQEARRTDGDEGLTSQEWIPDWIRTRGYFADWTGPQGNMFVGAYTTPSFLGI